MKQHGRRMMMLSGSFAGLSLAVSACGHSPAQGPDASGNGSWELLDAAGVSPETTRLQVGVVRTACAGGFTGTVLEPQVQFETKRIVIRTSVEPRSGPADCQTNNVVPLEIELKEPIGNRELFDALCLDSAELTTSFCTDGGVRWRP